jgi:hypothetical protein
MDIAGPALRPQPQPAVTKRQRFLQKHPRYLHFPSTGGIPGRAGLTRGFPVWVAALGLPSLAGHPTKPHQPTWHSSLAAQVHPLGCQPPPPLNLLAVGHCHPLPHNAGKHRRYPHGPTQLAYSRFSTNQPGHPRVHVLLQGYRDFPPWPCPTFAPATTNADGLAHETASYH